MIHQPQACRFHDADDMLMFERPVPTENGYPPNVVIAGHSVFYWNPFKKVYIATRVYDADKGHSVYFNNGILT